MRTPSNFVRFFLEKNVQARRLRPGEGVYLKENIAAIRHKKPAITVTMCAQEIEIKKVPAVEEVKYHMRQPRLGVLRNVTRKNSLPNPPRPCYRVGDMPPGKVERHNPSTPALYLRDGPSVDAAGKDHDVARKVGPPKR